MPMMLAAAGLLQPRIVPTITPDVTVVEACGVVSVVVADGPGDPGDWVAFDWQYLNGTQVEPLVGLKNATLTFSAPCTPGDYVLRLISQNGPILAVSVTVTVTPGSGGAGFAAVDDIFPDIEENTGDHTFDVLANDSVPGGSAVNMTIISQSGPVIASVVVAGGVPMIVVPTSGASSGSVAAPANTALPVISGTPTVGQTLSVTTGTWTGNPTPTYAYQWLRAGVNISGATAATYLLVTADIGQVSCSVTATNSQGSVSATSTAVTVSAVTLVAPANTALPVISGTPTVGQTLSVTTGTWTGNPTPTYVYQWLRVGADIFGATAATYILVTADIGQVSCRVTATNSQGAVSAISTAITVTGPLAAPANTALPVISGVPTVGQTLSVTTGTWTGNPAPTYAYQWLRAGVNISAATAATYLLVTADIGQVSCRVTATNSQGVVSSTSTAVTVSSVLASPANTALPVISGAPTVGQTLSVTDGTWTGNPTPTFTYQWLRAGVNIAGAAANTYLLVTSDIGQVSARVTATNSQGAVPATSTSVTVSASLAAPVNTALPVISGTPTVGQTLSTTNGAWTGNPTPTFTYQWLRAGANIAGATAATYLLVTADTGQVSCRVTATNSQGVVSATSTSVTVSSGLVAPANTVLPVISGTPTVGQTLSTTTGTWTGNPAPTYAYQWLRAGANISGATAATYLLVTADIGQVSVRVTATNSQGAVSATSAAVTVSAAVVHFDFGAANTTKYYDTANPSVTLPVPTSVSIWFTPVRTSTEAYETLFAHSYDSSRSISVFYRGPNAGVPNSIRVVIEAAGFATEAILVSSADVVALNQPALIVLTITSSDQFLYYCQLNGTVATLAHTTANITTLGVPFTGTRFGRGGASPLWCNQKLGPVGVYNKALTSAEAQSIANGTAPGTIGGVIALWGFGPDNAQITETVGGLTATRHP